MGGFIAKDAKKTQTLCSQEDTKRCLQWGTGFALKTRSRASCSLSSELITSPQQVTRVPAQLNLSLLCLLGKNR